MVPTGKRASARRLNSLGRHRNGADDDSARNINEFVGIGGRRVYRPRHIRYLGSERPAHINREMPDKTAEKIRVAPRINNARGGGCCGQTWGYELLLIKDAPRGDRRGDRQGGGGRAGEGKAFKVYERGSGIRSTHPRGFSGTKFTRRRRQSRRKFTFLPSMASGFLSPSSFSSSSRFWQSRPTFRHALAPVCSSVSSLHTHTHTHMPVR